MFGFFVLVDVLPRSFRKRIDDYMLYDEQSNTIYVVDARTYNEWIKRKGLVPNFTPNQNTKVVNMTELNEERRVKIFYFVNENSKMTNRKEEGVNDTVKPNEKL